MTREEYFAAVAEYKENHLEHHGIKGQKWGIRRYQNPDGTLTELGKKKYDKDLAEGEKLLSRYGSSKKLKKEMEVDRKAAIPASIAGGIVGPSMFPARTQQDRVNKTIGTIIGLTLAAATTHGISKAVEKAQYRKIRLAETKNIDEWLTNKGIKEKKLSDFSKVKNRYQDNKGNLTKAGETRYKNNGIIDLSSRNRFEKDRIKLQIKALNQLKKNVGSADSENALKKFNTTYKNISERKLDNLTVSKSKGNSKISLDKKEINKEISKLKDQLKKPTEYSENELKKIKNRYRQQVRSYNGGE